MSPALLARPAFLLRGRLPQPSSLLRAKRLPLRAGPQPATTSAARLQSTTAAAAADTTKAAASAARDTAAKATSSAAQGLSRVTSAAGPALAGAARGVTRTLGRMGGRTGRLIAFLEAQIPFVVYYSRVGIEVARLVFRGQKMAPPPLSTFQSYFQGVWQSLRNPGALLQSAQSTVAQSGNILQQARTLSRAQLVAGGVVLAELLGFFTVGEMVGRLKLVGYHGETGSHH